MSADKKLLESPTEERSVSARAVGVLLGVSTVTIYRLAGNGEIPCFRVGRRVLFLASEVDRWRRSRMASAIIE